MKKILAFISCLLIASAAVFADVSVKKLDNGQIEVTFFYGNPRATEVLLAGDFTNWQDGAEPMTKGDKGFTLVKVVPAGTVMKYKFISDGNWTEDLKEPDKVDDGFGGHNGLVDVDVLVAAASGSAAPAKPSIKFMTWTMLGSQAKFVTQSRADASKKGFDFDNATIGAKSYNKLSGNITPSMPFYVELAVAETELEPGYKANTGILYLAKKDSYGDWTVDPANILDTVSNIVASPVAALGLAGDKGDPLTNAYLGHLKFGFETPIINYTTGFMYAKQDKRAKVLWTTIDGNWDAGYQHLGGFASFSAGSTVQNLFADNGIKLDLGFVPNKSADRKGEKFGYIGWAGAEFSDLGLVVDFQSNGMYDGLALFETPVEHDFVFGAKDKIAIDDFGAITFATQGLVSTHQMDSEDIAAVAAGGVIDYFGYSTDVLWRTKSFDGIQNIAAEAKVILEGEDKTWGATVDYRMRGMQASMLFLRQNHDDGTFDLSSTLGDLNSQNIGLNVWGKFLYEMLGLSLDVNATLPLEKILSGDAAFVGYTTYTPAWYSGRIASDTAPVIGIESGAELTFKPAFSYDLEDIAEGMSINGYATMNYDAYTYEGGVKGTYAASDSAFRFKNAGLAWGWNNVSDSVKGINVYYGFDNANAARLFNTLVGSVTLPGDLALTAAFGLKTIKGTTAGQAYDAATNNPLAFALGCAKKINRLQKPIIYTQFCFNMDPYKNFGDGQDALALDGANVSSRWDKEAAVGRISAVDWYEGAAAIRAGIRWEL